MKLITLFSALASLALAPPSAAQTNSLQTNAAPQQYRGLASQSLAVRGGKSAFLLPKPVLSLQAEVLPRERFQYRGQGEVNGSLNFAGLSEVACTVKNVSAAPLKINTEFVGWYVNWSIDGPVARVIGWPCSADGPETITLAPGNTCAKMVPISFGDAKAGQKVTFRVRFISNPDMEFQRASAPNHKADQSLTVLSAPITMQVPK